MPMSTPNPPGFPPPEGLTAARLLPASTPPDATTVGVPGVPGATRLSTAEYPGYAGYPGIPVDPQAPFGRDPATGVPPSEKSATTAGLLQDNSGRKLR